MKMSLKFKMILIGVVLLLVPLGALTIISVIQTSNALQDMAREEMLKRTSEISESIQNVLNSEEKFIKGLALSRIAVEAFDMGASGNDLSKQERNEDLGGEFRKLNDDALVGGNYQVILAAGTDGIVTAASIPDYLGLNISDRQYLKDALAGKVNIGQPARNKVTNEPFIPVAAPITDSSGKVIGAVGAIMNLDFLWTLIKDSTRGKTGYTYVTDANALMIAHPDPSTLFELDISTLAGMENVVAKFRAGESGLFTRVNPKLPDLR